MLFLLLHPTLKFCSLDEDRHPFGTRETEAQAEVSVVLEGWGSPWPFFAVTPGGRLGGRSHLATGQILTPDSHHAMGEVVAVAGGGGGWGEVQVPGPQKVALLGQ